MKFFESWNQSAESAIDNAIETEGDKGIAQGPQKWLHGKAGILNLLVDRPKVVKLGYTDNM